MKTSAACVWVKSERMRIQNVCSREWALLLGYMLLRYFSAFLVTFALLSLHKHWASLSFSTHRIYASTIIRNTFTQHSSYSHRSSIATIDSHYQKIQKIVFDLAACRYDNDADYSSGNKKILIQFSRHKILSWEWNRRRMKELINTNERRKKASKDRRIKAKGPTA